MHPKIETNGAYFLFLKAKSFHLYFTNCSSVCTSLHYCDDSRRLLWSLFRRAPRPDNNGLVAWLYNSDTIRGVAQYCPRAVTYYNCDHSTSNYYYSRTSSLAIAERPRCRVC